MRMGFVQMRANDGFIPSGQKSADKFTADLMRLLRRHLSGPEGLDDMVTLHPVLVLAPAPFGRVHFRAGRGKAAVECVREQDAFCFGGIQCIACRCFQRGLFSVERIAHTTVKAGADRKYFCVCHSQTLPYKRKRLAAQPLQFLHLCGGNAFNRVGKARDLVDVVCDPGYLTDEPELFFRWPRLYFHTHDEIADDFAFSQPTLLTYFFEM